MTLNSPKQRRERQLSSLWKIWVRFRILGPHKFRNMHTHAHTCTHMHTHTQTQVSQAAAKAASPSPLTVARGPRGLHTLITQLTWSETPGKAVQYLITPSQTQARMTFTPVSLSVWLCELSGLPVLCSACVEERGREQLLERYLLFRPHTDPPWSPEIEH